MTTNETQVYLFRHGETDWNLNRRFQGHTDIPLNATGRLQAEALKDILDHFRPQMILSSDLDRAKETAAIGNAYLKIPVFESDLLRECGLGDAEGLFLNGGCIRRLLDHCINAPKDIVSIPNCAVYRLSFLRAERDWIFHGQVT